MSDNKSITFSDVEAIYKKLQLASGGNSWLEVDGYRFSSDMGYAFDGIDIYHKFLLKLFEEDFIPACEIVPHPAQLLYQTTTSPKPCPCGTADTSHSIACDGCRHFEYEHDMGASIPTCKLGKDMSGSCDSFEVSDLYLMYRGFVGEERRCFLS